jgi:type I restriction enzyme S subunit
MKLGEALQMGESKSINIEDDVEYVIAGVQSYGKGVINRRKEDGKDLKMKKYQVIEKDYLMWCKVDTKNGAFGITKKEHVGSLASTNMALGKINLEKLNPEFLERLFTFDFFYSYITHLSSGTTNRKYLTPKQLCEMVEIPNLSKVEQNNFIELVNKIENLEIDSELTHQLDLIKQLRQAFLREAMQGKLCHAELVSASQETGHDLLAKIKAEKAQLIADKKLKKEKELPPITEDEIPFEIPEHWAWCRLGEMSINFDGARKPISQSERQNKDKIYDYYGASGVIDKIDGFTHDGKFLLIGEDGANLIAKSTPIAFIAEGKFWVNNHAHVLDFLDDITKTYMKYCLNTIDIKPFISGGFQPKLNQANLNLMQIPLPPLHEQEQIVAKLEELMAFCDGLEQSIKESQGYNEQLLQQVLREALQG